MRISSDTIGNLTRDSWLVAQCLNHYTTPGLPMLDTGGFNGEDTAIPGQAQMVPGG